MSNDSSREKIKEDLFFLSFCNQKYIKGFKTIWAKGPRNTSSMNDIVDSIPCHRLANVRRQIDNALAWVSSMTRSTE